MNPTRTSREFVGVIHNLEGIPPIACGCPWCCLVAATQRRHDNESDLTIYLNTRFLLSTNRAYTVRGNTTSSPKDPMMSSHLLQAKHTGGLSMNRVAYWISKASRELVGVIRNDQRRHKHMTVRVVAVSQSHTATARMRHEILLVLHALFNCWTLRIGWCKYE